MTYATVSFFRDHFAQRGIDLPLSLVDADISAKILVASEWIDAKYRAKFPGLKIGGRDQVREWPRSGAVDYYGHVVASDSVPVEIMQATCEAAYRETQNPGILSVDWTPGQYKSVAISGAVSVQYAGFSSVAEIQTEFARITEILSGLIGRAQNDFSALSGAVSRA